MSRLGKIRDVALGLLVLAVAVALLGVAYLSYDRALVPGETITLRTDVVGNSLQAGSDVKLNGVPVGRVDRIRATAGGAEMALTLDPETLALVPDNTVARLLPKTMFGERYVALVPPRNASGRTLRPGDVIHQDASAEAAELQQVLDELLPVMRAVQPEKLSAMMGELAAMLRDNGEDLGDAMIAWRDYLQKLNPLVPTMADDLDRLSRVARGWNVAAPDLVDALATMTTTSTMLVDQQARLRDVYASVIGSADTTRGWVGRNHDTIVVLSRDSRAALRATAPYASQFPCLFRAVADYIPRMETVLGKGTDEPGMHATLRVVPSRGRYLDGVDTVRFTEGTPPPRCPYVTGQVGTVPAARVSLLGPAVDDPAAAWPAVPDTVPAVPARTTPRPRDPVAIGPPPGASVESHLRAITGLGDANSPGENQLIAELVAPTQGMAPGDYPLWNSLLLGPTLRNTKVVLR